MAEPVSSTINYSSTTYPGTISEKQKNEIAELIKTLGENNSITIGFHAIRLYHIQASISVIHPLIFLEEILGNPTSKENLKKVLIDGWRCVQKLMFVSNLLKKMHQVFPDKANQINCKIWDVFCEKVEKKQYKTIEVKNDFQNCFESKTLEQLLDQLVKD